MISWLIPTYQTPPQWLHECLISTIVELQEHDQILLIDDGTTDKQSIEAIIQYSYLNPNIRVIPIHKNEGVAKALNAGLSLVDTKTDYIARIDADDKNLTGRIKTQLKWLETHPADLCGGSMMMYYGNTPCTMKTQTAHAYMGNDYKDQLMKFKPICYHPSWLIKYKALSELGGYPTTYEHCEDFALQAKMLREGCTFTNTPEIIVNKRQHDNRVSNIYRSIQRENAKRVLKDFLK
jgi:glycosyltransferase involved in cell wall biosynthesis